VLSLLGTDGFSGSDIASAVNEVFSKLSIMSAIMCACVYFDSSLFLLQARLSPTTDARFFQEDALGNYSACRETDEKALEMSFWEVPPGRLLPSDLTLDDCVEALGQRAPSVGPEMIERLEQWSRNRKLL
jgi:SpoVK/Ycf46/Vps4 family AAA+-type ATPase